MTVYEAMWDAAGILSSAVLISMGSVEAYNEICRLNPYGAAFGLGASVFGVFLASKVDEKKQFLIESE